ncbi:MAG: hypothetical protein ACKOGP_05300, partial [Bacteroidota bacterium]
MPQPPKVDSSMTLNNPVSVVQSDSTAPMKSLFEGHLLQSDGFQIKPIEDRNADWFSISLFVLLAWFS